MAKIVSSLPGQNGFDNLIRKFGAVKITDALEKVIWDGNDANYDGWI